MNGVRHIHNFLEELRCRSVLFWSTFRADTGLELRLRISDVMELEKKHPTTPSLASLYAAVLGERRQRPVISDSGSAKTVRFVRLPCTIISTDTLLANLVDTAQLQSARELVELKAVMSAGKSSHSLVAIEFDQPGISLVDLRESMLEFSNPTWIHRFKIFRYRCADTGRLRVCLVLHPLHLLWLNVMREVEDRRVWKSVLKGRTTASAVGDGTPQRFANLILAVRSIRVTCKADTEEEKKYAESAEQQWRVQGLVSSMKDVDELPMLSDGDNDDNDGPGAICGDILRIAPPLSATETGVWTATCQNSFVVPVYTTFLSEYSLKILSPLPVEVDELITSDRMDSFWESGGGGGLGVAEWWIRNWELRQKQYPSPLFRSPLPPFQFGNPSSSLSSVDTAKQTGQKPVPSERVSAKQIRSSSPPSPSSSPSSPASPSPPKSPQYDPYAPVDAAPPTPFIPPSAPSAEGGGGAGGGDALSNTVFDNPFQNFTPKPFHRRYTDASDLRPVPVGRSKPSRALAFSCPLLA